MAARSVHTRTDRRAPPSRGPLAWGVLAAALALAALLLFAAPRHLLDWQPALAPSQPWRLWSAGLVHLSAGHLLANLAGCAVVGAFGIAARVSGASVVAWLLAWPLGHAALAWQPQLLHYAGLSGLLHAGVVVVALPLVWRGTPQQRWVGAAVLAGLGAKLLLERPWLTAVQQVPGWDIPIASVAHLSGALAGLVCGAGALAWAGRTPAQAGAGVSGGTGASERTSSLR